MKSNTLLTATAACLGLLLSFSAQALDILTTTASLGALTRDIGGEQVKVSVMAPPDRDPHDLTAKPSLLSRARSADGLVSIGAGLEEGWLPAVLEQAGNPRIQPGQPGSLVATQHVELIKETREGNPFFGHIHKQGNPHIQMDPVRMARVAEALGVWLAQLDPAHSAEYRSRAEQVAQRLNSFSQNASTQLKGASGVVLYHEDALYFLTRFNIPLLGTLEPFPGVPPSATHLQELIQALRGKRGMVIRAPYQAEDGAEMLAHELDWKAVALPMEPAANADVQGYLAMLEKWVSTLAKQP